MSDGLPADTYIETTQADGRLLLRFIARRSDRSLALSPAQPPGGALDFDVLFEDPKAVATDPQKVNRLVACVDNLGVRAAPANVRSIRLTTTYLGIAIEDGEPPRALRREAMWCRFYMFLVGALAVLLLIVCVGMLVHMEAGRRLLQQLGDLRQLEQGVQKDIATLALSESMALGVLERRVAALPDGKPGLVVLPARPELLARLAVALGREPEAMQAWASAAPLCDRPLYLPPKSAGTEVAFLSAVDDADLAKFALTWWREPVTAKAAAICGRRDDLRVRLALLYAGMADWNCRSHQMFAVLAAPYEAVQTGLGVAREGAGPACGAPTGALPPEVGMDAWRSHETRVTIASSVVSGFLLPLLLGCLGGCAYAMRRIDQKLSNWTLEPQDGRHSIVRVALAAVLGGLVGVVWTGGDTVAVGGFSLSLAAASFFVGFSVEPVFRVIETVVIEGLLKKAGPPRAAQ